MLSLHIDLILLISQQLSDAEKIYLTMICKQIDPIKHKMMYKTNVDMKRIISLSYFDNFENIEMYAKFDIVPKCAKRIHLYTDSTDVPDFVTHVTFDDRFNSPIVRKIPTSVTHITFGNYFNRLIYRDIPSSVTHVMLGRSFIHFVSGSLPTSVTHLKIDPYFVYTSMRYFVPPSVTHLSFGPNFNLPINTLIPSFVTHLAFGEKFNHPIIDIPSSVVEIAISKNHTEYIHPDLLPKILII
uniref:F-box domain-containing protein n=1 Tax=viral metagenome TaxID=1070528 RepID=A0A6C0C9F9_9ZZZZ